MRLSVLSSGSSGNAAFIESNGTGVLVDAGLTPRRTVALLARIGRCLQDIDAIFVTHAHRDHTLGAKLLARACGVRVYAGSGVAEALDVVKVPDGGQVEVGGIEAAFFSVPHDSPTYGIKVSGAEDAVAVLTDLGEVEPPVLENIRGVEAVVLEANHDRDWLQYGPYPLNLKFRVASPFGHLSNHQAAEAAVELARYGLKDLVLAHLSKTNNSPARARGTVYHRLRSAGFGDVRVQVAPRNSPTSWIEVGETSSSLKLF